MSAAHTVQLGSTLGLSGILLAAVAVGETLVRRDLTRDQKALRLTVGTGLSAAAVHAAVVPHHLRESLLHACGLATIAVAQLVLPLLLRRRPTRLLLQAWALSCACVLGLWLVSRTAGLPGEPAEPVGLADGLCGLLEAVAIGTALVVLRPGAARVRRRRVAPVA